MKGSEFCLTQIGTFSIHLRKDLKINVSELKENINWYFVIAYSTINVVSHLSATTNFYFPTF